MGSKHDVKISEIATDVVGADGWYVSINAAKLTAEIIPSEPPTFEAVIPYAFSAKVVTFQQDRSAWAKIPLREKLGQNGSKGSVRNVDLDADPHTQISGTSCADITRFPLGKRGLRQTLKLIMDRSKRIRKLTKALTVSAAERGGSCSLERIYDPETGRADFNYVELTMLPSLEEKFVSEDGGPAALADEWL